MQYTYDLYHIVYCELYCIQWRRKVGARGARSPHNFEKAGADPLQKQASIYTKYSNITVTTLIEWSIGQLY